MPIAKLTKRFVGTVAVNSRRVVYYDTDLKGFGLRVTPTGVKSWCVEYRHEAGGEALQSAELFSVRQVL